MAEIGKLSAWRDVSGFGCRSLEDAGRGDGPATAAWLTRAGESRKGRDKRLERGMKVGADRWNGVNV